MSTKKDVKEMVVRCARMGLATGKTMKGHWFVVCPNGHKVFTSGTPSDCMVLVNFRSKLRRNGVQV